MCNKSSKASSNNDKNKRRKKRLIAERWQLDEAQKRYKLAQKKIEFYLSWCLEYWGGILESANLSEAVKDWVEGWDQDASKEGETLSILNASPTIKSTVRIAR